MKFSVLMSVYFKERGTNLDQALESILINQSTIPDELVLVKDGPLTDELDKVIDKYKKMYPQILKIKALSENVGLGKALNIGLSECSYSLVARMDSDDICAFQRFERQLKQFEEDQDLDLVGANIIEFFNSPNEPKFIRKVPSDRIGIRTMIKKRNPINHVSVMFKKESVLNAGGYMHLPFLEDYYLWVRMINNDCVIKNIDEELVYVRTGAEMFKRRSNREYISSWHTLQKVLKKYNLINYLEFIINMISISCFIIIPPRVKAYIYKLLFRKPISLEHKNVIKRGYYNG